MFISLQEKDVETVQIDERNGMSICTSWRRAVLEDVCYTNKDLLYIKSIPLVNASNIGLDAATCLCLFID